MGALFDTIAAIATGSAPTALGIVRISGPASAVILQKVVPRTENRLIPRRVISGVARDPHTGEPLDTVICFYCKGPATATGEDIAELQGHGGKVVMRRLLNAVLSAGARPAEPGELTYRAFRNGRMDLTQAEAVMGLIGAQSERSARVAVGQLQGGLGRELGEKLDRLNRLAAHLEAGLDFPDEDLPLTVAKDLASELSSLAQECGELARSFTLGARLGEGATVAIVGPPNAGKSSLFNRLVGAERAIVDPEPGTTRDMVEMRGEIAGVPLSFRDTAGLRESDSRVEQVGMERSREAMKSADLVVLVLDGTAVLSEEEMRQLAKLSLGATDWIPVLNKKDLPGWRRDSAAAAFPGRVPIPVSSLTGEGLTELTAAMGRMLEGGYQGDTSVLTTARQHRAVSDVTVHLSKAKVLLLSGGEPELAALELRWARETLSALLGRSATDEMLTALFSEFCIGK